MDTPEYTILIGQLDKSTGMWGHAAWWEAFCRKCFIDQRSYPGSVLKKYGGRIAWSCGAAKNTVMIVFTKESDMTIFLLEHS